MLMIGVMLSIVLNSVPRTRSEMAFFLRIVAQLPQKKADF
jgi:hypothetical protein